MLDLTPGKVSAVRKLEERMRVFGSASASTAAWWLAPHGTPSFMHKYLAFLRVYEQALALSGLPHGSFWPWENKDEMKSLANSIGVRTPRTFQGPGHITDIDWAVLPDHFVIKPTNSAGGRAVFALKASGAGYWDAIRGRHLSRNEIMNEFLLGGREGQQIANSVIVEQALVDNAGLPAYDWKCYAFQGDVQLVWQISRSPSGRRMKYYDRHFRSLGAARYRTKVTPELPTPTSPSGIISAASRLSKVLPLPFVRVDLYEFEGEVLLGELTPTPGSRQRFMRGLDRAMGQAWERAESALLIEQSSQTRLL